jgi:hypothetical protein
VTRKFVVCVCLALLVAAALAPASSGLLLAILIPLWFFLDSVSIQPYIVVEPLTVRPLSLFSIAGCRAPPACSWSPSSNGRHHQEDFVSIKTTLHKLCFGGMLGLASLMGAAMRPEEIEALMRDMNVPKIVHTLEDENDEDDDAIPPASAATSSEALPVDPQSY